MFDDLDITGRLSSQERRNLIRETLPRVFQEGLSVNAAFNAYKDAGLGIRKSDFSNLYYSEAPRLIQAGRVGRLGADDEITESVLAQSAYQLEGKYRYIGVVSYYDTVTDELVEDEFGIDTNLIGTVDEIRASIIEAYATRYRERSPYLADAVILRGYYSK